MKKRFSAKSYRARLTRLRNATSKTIHDLRRVAESLPEHDGLSGPRTKRAQLLAVVVKHLWNTADALDAAIAGADDDSRIAGPPLRSNPPRRKNPRKPRRRKNPTTQVVSRSWTTVDGRSRSETHNTRVTKTPDKAAKKPAAKKKPGPVPASRPAAKKTRAKK